MSEAKTSAIRSHFNLAHEIRFTETNLATLRWLRMVTGWKFVYLDNMLNNVGHFYDNIDWKWYVCVCVSYLPPNRCEILVEKIFRMFKYHFCFARFGCY